MSRLLLTLCLVSPALGQQLVTAQVDRDQIELREVVTLRVNASGGNVQAPDLEAAGWRLVGQTKGVSNVNGRVTSLLTLQLQAVRAGNLVIGPFRVRTNRATYESKPIVVQVSAEETPNSGGGGGGSGSAPGAPRDKHAWVEWDVDRAQVWMGEEVRARLYLFVHPQVRLSNVDTSDLDLKGWWTEHTGQRRRSNREVRVGGDPYTRIELGFYHLFALRPGALELPAVTVKLRQARGFFDEQRGGAATRTAEPLPIIVKPLPKPLPPGFAGPTVGAVKLTATVDRSRINADEGVQLTVETRVRGGRVEAAPEIALPPMPGFRVFPPSAETNSQVQRGQTRGFRRQRWLLRPKKGGRSTIPSLRLPFFDPARGKFETARTAPIHITVRGKPSADGATAKKATTVAKDAPALRTIRKDVDLGTRDRPSHLSAWFLLALLLPPLGFIGLVARDRALLHLGATAGGRNARKAGSVALGELSKVPRDPQVAYAEIARTLLVFLEARFEHTFRGLTHGQLGDVLRAREVDPGTVRDLVAELENCDFARFAPAADAGAVDAAVARAVALVKRVEEAS